MAVSLDELRVWSRYIYSITGISLDDSKGYLVETRLAGLMRETGSASYSELLHKVKADAMQTLRRKVVDAIKSGAAQCWALDIKPPRLFDGNRNPGFKSYMQLKDMNIILDTAKEYDVPISATVENTRLFQQMIDMGLGELDNSAVVGVIEKLAGVGILD